MTDDPTQTDLSKKEMLWLMWLKNSDVMVALGVAQWTDSICHQDLISPLLDLLSWLSFKLASVSTTCSFYSQKRAEATPDQTVSDSGPTWESQVVFPKKSQQKPYFFLIDFD